MQKKIWRTIIALIIIVVLIFIIFSHQTRSADAPSLTDGVMSTSTINGTGTQHMVPVVKTTMIPINIHDSSKEGIINYTFSCVKGRTMDAKIVTDSKDPRAEVVIYDSTQNKSGTIESRSFVLLADDSAEATSTTQYFKSKDNTASFVFGEGKATLSEYGKTTLYKDCRLTASEFVQ